MTGIRWQIAVLAGIGVAIIGVVVTIGLRGNSTPPDQASVGNYDPRKSSIQAALENAARERTELAAEISELRRLLAYSVSKETESGPADASEEGRQNLGEEDENPNSPASGTTTSGFDSDALGGSGLRPDEVDRLQDLWHETMLLRSELDVRAAREGWADTARHWREARELELEAEATLGEVEYDAYLYASGKPNRLVVRDVINGSVAQGIGLEAGDHILRYDGNRLYSSAELQNAVSLGDAWETVRLVVERDGESLVFAAPRESLGVTTVLTRVRPEY